mmetsp:Transcript_360/g.658  ORF Transcript_360/g.658 Transcript_360/m.658 type:complete len:239 (+) Transcript_360:390-1106(+)
MAWGGMPCIRVPGGTGPPYPAGATPPGPVGMAMTLPLPNATMGTARTAPACMYESGMTGTNPPAGYCIPVAMYCIPSSSTKVSPIIGAPKCGPEGMLCTGGPAVAGPEGWNGLNSAAPGLNLNSLALTLSLGLVLLALEALVDDWEIAVTDGETAVADGSGTVTGFSVDDGAFSEATGFAVVVDVFSGAAAGISASATLRFLTPSSTVVGIALDAPGATSSVGFWVLSAVLAAAAITG